MRTPLAHYSLAKDDIVPDSEEDDVRRLPKSCSNQPYACLETVAFASVCTVLIVLWPADYSRFLVRPAPRPICSE
jgi:hypothetical protein